MLASAEDVQVPQHQRAQPILRQHPLHRALDNIFGAPFERLCHRPLLKMPRVARVLPVDFPAELPRRNGKFLRVDDDDMIPPHLMRGEGGLMLAPEEAGDTGRQAAGRFALGIDEEPLRGRRMER